MIMEKRFIFSVGSIILDDNVLFDGQTRMGVLGGGSTHTAKGDACLGRSGRFGGHR